MSKQEGKPDIKQARHFEFAITGQYGKKLAYKENGIWTVHNIAEALDVLFENTKTLNNENSELKKENEELKEIINSIELDSKKILGEELYKRYNDNIKENADLESKLSKSKGLLKEASLYIQDFKDESEGLYDEIELFLKS